MGSLKQSPFFDIFLDLKKAYDAMDQDHCLKIPLDVGVGEKMVHGRQFHSCIFHVGRSMTQGAPLFSTIFNLMVDAIVQESERQLITGRVGRGGIRIHIW